MSVKVTASFQNIEEYEIKVETTMNYAQWKMFLEDIKTKWREPMASFVKPVQEALEGLEAAITKIEKDN